MTGRLTAFAALLLLIVILISRRRWATIALGTVAFLFEAMSVSPYDVSLRNAPGPPHFVRLVMGLPTQGASLKARRGETMLGGCMVNGFEPEYVLVW